MPYPLVWLTGPDEARDAQVTRGSLMKNTMSRRPTEQLPELGIDGHSAGAGDR
ncbi:hypothetical protein [Streptomyces violascens]|uniref:hypothetical protein n=1 Tax=Streptomyces violascens TaxID=67381 RepID=UPI001CFD9982|nr:hypothetical protein [Streptomyces violascens]